MAKNTYEEGQKKAKEIMHEVEPDTFTLEGWVKDISKHIPDGINVEYKQGRIDIYKKQILTNLITEKDNN